MRLDVFTTPDSAFLDSILTSCFFSFIILNPDNRIRRRQFSFPSFSSFLFSLSIVSYFLSIPSSSSDFFRLFTLYHAALEHSMWVFMHPNRSACCIGERHVFFVCFLNFELLHAVVVLGPSLLVLSKLKGWRQGSNECATSYQVRVVPTKCWHGALSIT